MIAINTARKSCWAFHLRCARQGAITSMASFAETKDSSQTTGNMETVFDFSVSNFATLVTTTAFVDKTMMIKDIFRCSSRIMITAPPRFGKSTNIDMVKRFLEIEVDMAGTPKAAHTTKNYTLFKDNDLEICKHEEFFNEHFGKHPVIYINFEPLGRVGDFVNMLDVFRTIIQKSFNQHNYLLYTNSAKSSFCWADDFDIDDFKKFVSHRLIKDVDVTDIMCSFMCLSNVLYRYFGRKVFVLIDNYDAFVDSMLFKNRESMEKIISFVETTIDNLLNNSLCVERALLTGVRPVTGDGFPSFVNNIDCYYFLASHSFCRYYGLTSDELDKVLKKLIKDDKERNEIKRTIDEHYSEYVTRNQSVRVYNIWSALQYLCRREVQSYWCSRVCIKSFKPIFKNSQIRDKVVQLLSGNALQLDTSQQLSATDILQLNDIITNGEVENASSSVVDTFFILLYHLGYLSTSEVSCWGFVNLKFPNEEIKRDLTKVVFGDQTTQTFDSDGQVHDEDKGSATETFPELDKVLQNLIQDDEERNKTERTIDEYYNGNSDGNQSGQTYNIWSVTQYLRRKRVSSYWCIRVVMTNFKPLFGVSQIRDKVEQLLMGNELQLDASQPLSTKDVLQLNDIITRGKVKDLSSPALDTFFVLLYYFGYLSVSNVLHRRYVYVKIPADIITRELANVVFETNKWLFYKGDQYVDKVRSAVGSFLPGSTDQDKTFEPFIEAISCWREYLERSTLELVNTFMAHLFMILVTTPEYSQTVVVRNLGPDGPVVILLKNKHQVGVCITAQRDTSDEPTKHTRRKSAADAHNSVTCNCYEDKVFDDEYNSNKLCGKVLIGIGYHRDYDDFAISYSYYFNVGDSLRKCKTVVYLFPGMLYLS